MMRTTKHPVNNPIDSVKINQIRLEHFENYKNLRRRMDRAYLKMRHLQSKGVGGNGNRAKKDAFIEKTKECNTISDPVYDETKMTYNKISQTLNSLHSQQVYFGGFYGHNDPISPMTANGQKNLNSTMQPGATFRYSGVDINQSTVEAGMTDLSLNKLAFTQGSMQSQP